MRIDQGDPLYVVGEENVVSEMTFYQLQLSIEGGTKWEDIEVFTDQKEAESVAKANGRRHILDQFTDAHMNDAQAVSLLDIDGNTIASRQFQTALRPMASFSPQ